MSLQPIYAPDPELRGQVAAFVFGDIAWDAFVAWFWCHDAHNRGPLPKDWDEAEWAVILFTEVGTSATRRRLTALLGPGTFHSPFSTVEVAFVA